MLRNISIIIPTYNAAPWVVETLESIVGHAGPGTEIIVVDDKSTDDTVSVVNTFAAGHQMVKVLQLPENVGPGAARNAGFKAARGEYVLFFDADDIMIGENVAEAISLLDKYQVDVAILSYIQCSSRDTSQFSTMLGLDEDLYRSILADSDCRIFKLKNYPQILRTTNFPWNKIFRRSAFEATNFSFPEYRLHEDILPSWHLLVNAGEIVCLKKPVGYHFVSPFAANETNKKTRQRLDIFNAIGDVAHLLEARQVDWQIYREFIYFVVDVLSWVKDNLPKECLNEFRAGVRSLFGSLNETRITYLVEEDAGLSYHLHGKLMELSK